MSGAASPQKIGIAERRAMALDLRKQGSTYRHIAATLSTVAGISEKYDHSGARRDVADELRKYNEANKESAGILKRLELERLDQLWHAYWAPAIGGDIAAAGYLLKLMERRARLEGLDAPTAMKHSGDAENPVAVKARSFTIRIDRRADEDLSVVDTLETAGAVPVGTLAAFRAALVALDGDRPIAGLPGRIATRPQAKPTAAT